MILRCPNCNRIPKLTIRNAEVNDTSLRPIIRLRYECRKWFGLRRCFGKVVLNVHHRAEPDQVSLDQPFRLVALCRRNWNEAVAIALL